MEVKVWLFGVSVQAWCGGLDLEGGGDGHALRRRNRVFATSSTHPNVAIEGNLT